MGDLAPRARGATRSRGWSLGVLLRPRDAFRAALVDVRIHASVDGTILRAGARGARLSRAIQLPDRGDRRRREILVALSALANARAHFRFQLAEEFLARIDGE